MSARVRVFIASSIDGFIAGTNDDLSWLPEPDGSGDFGFTDFMADVGALLMGRGTYDVVERMEGDWYYGKTPVLVATHRPLIPKVPTVRAVDGNIESLVAEALRTAAGKDVYLDGGVMIRAALDAGLVDELIVSLIPVILGAGHPLFAGAQKRHPLELVQVKPLAGKMVQITWRPVR
jgi:dihydrofolate reductase